MARSSSRTGSRAVRLLLGSAIVLAVGAVAGLAALYIVFLRDLPDLNSLADYRPALTSVVVDREGRPIGEFYEQRRVLLPLEEIPAHTVQAFIAAEDDAFYEHRGIDFRSILRAAWANFRAGGETVQGASTITQQMVKQLLLSSERTYRRKVREMILARQIENRFSKDEILFLYLNEIYFGSGAYGVGEAARTYFGKEAPDLSVGESALLAALPKAPARFSPYRNPDRAETRRRYVLQRMHEEGFIDDAALDEAAAEPALRNAPERADFAAAAYFTEEVRRTLVEALGNERVLRGGLTIETTIDLDLQRSAYRAVRNGIEAVDRRQGYRGPLRRVEQAGLAEEIASLAEKNGIPDGDDATDTLPGDGPWEAVVTAVSNKRKRASIAFGGGIEGTVTLADVGWAWPADGKVHRGDVKKIASVFAVGDVARFVAVDPEARGADARFALDQQPEAQGALLSFDVGNGDVLAMIGGYDFEASEFNRALQAQRQPGSAFKPVIYAAALAKGMTPASMLYDRPVVYDDPESGFTWRPENYGRRFLGPLLMSEALARSVNNATIHLLRDIGVSRVVNYARKVGIRSPLEPNLSLALGASPVTLLELTRAYGVFAGGGTLREPRFIRRVVDREGEELLANLLLADPIPEATAEAEAANGEPPAVSSPGEAPARQQVVPDTEAYLVTDLLRGVVEHPRGTGRRAQSLGHPVAGKTGTTNEQGDAWFVGYSADVVTGAWVGHDESRVLGRGETGGRAALPIWLEFMQAALEERAERDFPVPDGIVFTRIDARSGLIAGAESQEVRFQPFLAGTAPTKSAATATTATERRRRLRLGF